jgi:uncharacterized RDD family membrane protein YckC
MAVPFSHEVKTAVDLAAGLKDVVIWFCIIHAIFLGIFLIAVIGLLITVNPDLVEEWKALVTPVLNWGSGFMGAEINTMGEKDACWKSWDFQERAIEW